MKWINCYAKHAARYRHRDCSGDGVRSLIDDLYDRPGRISIICRINFPLERVESHVKNAIKRGNDGDYRIRRLIDDKDILASQVRDINLAARGIDDDPGGNAEAWDFGDDCVGRALRRDWRDESHSR